MGKPESPLQYSLRFDIFRDGRLEWLLFELQGTLDLDGDVASKLLGHFAWRKDGHISLIIGHQLLDGKLVDMERPFIVVNGDNRARPSDIQAGSECATSLAVNGVVRRKVVFKLRPKPIVAAS